ncbi:MAG: hypothetical protein CMK59_00765 [Proteobacteria bacterium]|nr:hypothetical protein [Pseudomonadota bacterium]
MKAYGYLYISSLVALLIGERLFSGSTELRYLFSIGSVILIAGAIYVALQNKKSASEHQHKAYGYPVIILTLSSVGHLIYGLSTESGLNLFSQEPEATHKLKVIFQCLAVLVWTCTAPPLIALAKLHSSSPRHLQNGPAKQVMLQWLGAAFAFASIAPLNYVAQAENIRWDLGYFKTATLGTSTLSLAQNLDEPIQVYLFYPSSSEVRQELRGYFKQLENTSLEISYLDHALEPELSKELKVRDNGYIAFVRGSGDNQQVERLKIPIDFSGAKRKLKKLDGEVRERLLKMAKGPRVVYLTTGHGEFHWKSDKDRSKEEQINDLKKVLKSFNYSVKELSLANGLGNQVPADAGMVMVLGPQTDFLPTELDSLRNYRNSGGSLLVALEPAGSTPTSLLEDLKLSYDANRYLLHSRVYIPRKNATVDQRNLATNKFSTHASVTTLSVNNKELPVIFPEVGALRLETGTKAKATIRSLEETFLDSDGNLKKSQGEESKVWELSVAIEEDIISSSSEDTNVDDSLSPEQAQTEENEKETEKEDETPVKSRTLVFADATWLSDILLLQNKGNGQAFVDAVAWLMDEPDAGGSIEDESDIKVQHTKEGQGWIFALSSLLIPLMIIIFGIVRVRLRKKEN